MSTITNERSRLQAVGLARGRMFIGTLQNGEGLVNLAGIYDYLSLSYYVSQDFEYEGKGIRPTCKEMLDAYVPPLFLEKARIMGIPVPEYYISNGYFEPPVIVDPINPFTLKGRIVMKAGHVKHIARSLTRNFTYAICCQELPPGSSVAYFRSILGWSLLPRYRELSEIVWNVFNIPLARVRIINLESGQQLLSDISPLFFEDLNRRELQYIEGRISWDN